MFEIIILFGCGRLPMQLIKSFTSKGVIMPQKDGIIGYINSIVLLRCFCEQLSLFSSIHFKLYYGLSYSRDIPTLKQYYFKTTLFTLYIMMELNPVKI